VGARKLSGSLQEADSFVQEFAVFADPSVSVAPERVLVLRQPLKDG